METFFYKALDKNKTVTWGSIKEKNEARAQSALRKQQLKNILISKEKIPRKPSEVPQTFLSNYIFRDDHGKTQIALGAENPTAKDLAVFTKQLATMISSGVQLIEAFEIIRRQQKKKRLL